jgi:tetratricopeptide (TPR) repeat protein
MLLGAASAYFAFRIGSRVSAPAGRVAGLVVALSPVPIVYENQLLYTSLAIFLTAAFLLAFLRSASAGSRRAAAGAGALLGTLSLTSASALLFAPFGAWEIFRRRRVAIAAMFALGVALPLLPVLLRNGIFAGTWTPLTSNGGMLFATGFAEESRGGRALLRTPADFGPDGAYLREAEQATGRDLSLAEASRWHRDRTLERIARDPAGAIRLVVRKVGLLVNAREIDDNLGPAVFAPRSRVLRWVPAPWGLVGLAALVGASLSWRRRDKVGDDVRLLATFVLVYAASLLPFFVTARYRLPLLIPLAVLAGVAVDGVRLAWQRGERRRLVVPAALALALSPFVFRDPGVGEDPAVAGNAAGAALLNEGHPAEALALLDRAIATEPTLAGAHANRALALVALGRNEEALAASREAVRHDSTLADAWLTQGALLARSGRVAEALPAFRRAAELRPSDPRAWRTRRARSPRPVAWPRWGTAWWRRAPGSSRARWRREAGARKTEGPRSPEALELAGPRESNPGLKTENLRPKSDDGPASHAQISASGLSDMTQGPCGSTPKRACR